MLAPLDVGEGGLVGGDQPSARAHLNREVAQGETAFHRHLLDGLPGIFDEMTGCARGGETCDEIERHILGGHTLAKRTVDRDAHGLGFLLEDALGSHHHLDLARADAERHSTHGAVRARVGVATDDGHAGKRQPLLGAYDVNDAVVGGVHGIMRQPEVLAISSQQIDLLLGDRVDNGLVLVVGGRVMVGHAEDLLGSETLQPALPHAGERLRRRHLMAIEAVDIELGRSVVHNLHHMLVPNLVKQCVHGQSFLNLLIQSI